MLPKASTGLMSADEAATFSAYDTSHQAAIGILVVGIALLIWLVRFRIADPGDRLGKVLAVSLTMGLAVPLPSSLYFTPGYWDLQKTLPIQLCDLPPRSSRSTPCGRTSRGRSAWCTTGG